MQRRDKMFSAPAADQNMPECLQRPPITVLHPASTSGEIKMVAIRNRGAMRGVRLVAYDSVLDYIRRSMDGAVGKNVASAESASAAPAEQIS